MYRTRSFTLLLTALLLAPVMARADVLEAGCLPSAVRVDAQRVEILCTEAVVLGGRSQDRFREVLRFAYPMVAQSYQPLLGSQGKLLDYFLEMAQHALTHSLALQVWFEEDSAQSRLFGCDPRDCRALVALAITREPPAAPAEATPATDEIDTEP